MDDIFEAPLFKRILAGTLDFLVTILLSISIFMLLANGALDIGFHNLELKNEQFRLEEESSLFKVTREDDKIVGLESLTFDTKKENEDQKFLKAINDYYFKASEVTNKSIKELNINFFKFDETTLENNIYKINDINSTYTSFVLKNEIKNKKDEIVSVNDKEKYLETIKEYFLDEKEGVYFYSLTHFTNSKKFQEIAFKLQNVERYEVMISVGFSTLLFLCIPSLINKNGQTPFMFVFKIGCSNSAGYKIKFKHKALRAVAFLVLFTASAYLFMIPLIINYIVVFCNKNRRSLIDFFSETVAIDLKTSVLYESEEGMLSKSKKW